MITSILRLCSAVYHDRHPSGFCYDAKLSRVPYAGQSRSCPGYLPRPEIDQRCTRDRFVEEILIIADVRPRLKTELALNAFGDSQYR